MSYPKDLESIKALFASRGAHIYWQNSAQLNVWYHSYMLPEILKVQQELNVECRRESKRRKKLRRKKKSRPKESQNIWQKGMKVDIDEGRFKCC